GRPGDVAVRAVQGDHRLLGALPLDEVGGAPDVDVLPAPARVAVGGGVDVVGVAEHRDVRVGVVAVQHRAGHLLGAHGPDLLVPGLLVGDRVRHRFAEVDRGA